MSKERKMNPLEGLAEKLTEKLRSNEELHKVRAEKRLSKLKTLSRTKSGDDLSSDFESPEKTAGCFVQSGDDLSSDFESPEKKRRFTVPTAVPASGSDRKKAITCKFCKLTFASWPSVSRHRKTCLQNPDRGKHLHNCQICGKQFSRQYVFLAHIKGCKAASTGNSCNGSKKNKCPNSSDDSKRTKCPVPGCSADFLFKNSLHQHLIDFHKRTDLKNMSTYKFKSFDEFVKWKIYIEDKTFSYYAQQYGKRNDRIYY